MIKLSSFYNASLYLFGKIMNLIGLANPKAKKWVNGRTIIKENYLKPPPKKQPIWFHCASLGEFEQARPLIELIKNKHPEHKVLLTFYSPSGYEIRKNYDQADYITYLPIDLPSEVNRFLEFYNPKMALFAKYEFWRNFVEACKDREIPIYSFSTIFRANQVYFKKGILGRNDFAANTLRHFNHFFVQDNTSGNLLSQIGINKFTITGDTRYDRVKEIAEHKKDIEKARLFKGESSLMVVGSAWAEDMAILIPLINSKALEDFKVIVAPHEIRPKEIKEWQNELNVPSCLYSEPISDLNNQKLMFIDNIGLLSSLYQYADYAFIGGAYNAGLHNSLEAAIYGMPIYFGNKNYKKFKEALDLIDLGVALPVASTEELSASIKGYEKNRDIKNKINEACKRFVIENCGATETIYLHILPEL